MSTKGERLPSILDRLGGRDWLRAMGLRVDVLAPVPPGAVALAYESAEGPRPNRAVVMQMDQGGFRIEYWRVEGKKAEATGEKEVAKLRQVPNELVRAFGVILEPAVAA